MFNISSYFNYGDGIISTISTTTTSSTTTAPVATYTSVIPEQDGQTLANITDPIVAITVVGATRYEFRISSLSLPDPILVSSSGPTFSLNSISGGALYDTDYTISVRTFGGVGGDIMIGDFGTSVVITTPSESFVCQTCTGTDIPIGNQTWKQCNAEHTTYRDGDPIFHVTDITTFPNYTIGAWCYYADNSANGPIFGKLYNWYAVAGIYDATSLSNPALRKDFAPDGYHVPSEAEWTVLTDYLDAQVPPGNAGGKMKSTGTLQAGDGCWTAPNTDATNSSGFKGQPAGYLSVGGGGGSTSGLNTSTYFWSTTLSGSNVQVLNLDTNNGVAAISSTVKNSGLSVRLIQDEWVLTIQTTAPNQEYSLNINGVSPNININWGDGNSANVTSDGVASRTYADVGIYQVRVSGSFVSDGNISQTTMITAARVIATSRIRGISGMASMSGVFIDCVNLASIPDGLFDDHTTVTNFTNAFRSCSFESIPTDLFKYNTLATNFTSVFQSCSDLLSIPDTLFQYNTLANTFSTAFLGCTSLISIPAILFLTNTAVTNFSLAFQQCTGLTSIPNDLFRYNTQVTNFSSTFQDCVGLTNPSGMPTDLFRYNILVTNFSSTFQGCIGLTYIGYDLFQYNEQVTNFNLTFRDCTSLHTIYPGVFDNNPLVNTFVSTFQGCSSLTTNIPLSSGIPVDLFKYNTLVTTFLSTFSRCTSLNTIPAGLFANNPLVTTFGNTFNECTNLASIPPNLFDGNPLVTDFTSTFNECRSITSIPPNLFDGNPLVNAFVITFGSCVNLVSIPPGLFDLNPLVTTFSFTFTTCTSLNSMPPGLFANNPLVTTFSFTFKDCTSLNSIPLNLFIGNPLVDTFQSVFYKCASLASIPVGLFDGNPLVTTFSSAFAGCSLLTSMPADLFINNTAATNFSYTFQLCQKLTQNTAIFGGSPTTRFLDQSVDFSGMFNIQVGSFTGTQGTAPELWNYSFGTGTPIKTVCWRNQSTASLTNYDDIPGDWL